MIFPMPIVTLTTDFGLNDEYVGVMKGVILSVNPAATIVDITHNIEPQDLISAAYLIKSFYAFFPKNTIHVVVVDPGVGSDRTILAAGINDYIFLAPNNGVLSLLLKEGAFQCGVLVENSEYFLSSVSRTFHGRDIFASVAAHLSKGRKLKDLGTEINQANLISLSIDGPSVSKKGELHGSVISVDRFGNLITNIDEQTFERFCSENPGKQPKVIIGNHKAKGPVGAYSAVRPGQLLSIIGSRGLLEIGVNQGSAKQYLSAAKGDAVTILLV